MCSGIEAASVAFGPLGWRACAMAETAKFPSAVLAHRWPGVPNYGDVLKFRKWPDHAPALVIGGTPCQSFSVAGFRAALADPRGSLTLTYLGIADRYRPRWLVWENVPGVLHADRGRAFGTFLGGLAQLGYGFAYRVLDAQYFGVPQQRRRVFVVGYLGDWRPPAAVLFERESLRGDTAPGRAAWPKDTPEPAPRINRNGQYDGHIARALLGKMPRIDGETETFIPVQYFDANASGSRGFATAEGIEVAGTLRGMTRADGSPNHCAHAAIASPRHGLRRLTPREYERLQGFPDDYTLVPYAGRPASDGPRYAAVGNSMPVPLLAWIGARIAAIDAIVT